MARTIAEIKKSMTDRFMSDGTILERYGLKAGDSFDAKFSKVSIENILFFTVAAVIYALESMFDAFRTDVEQRISNAVVASIPWYHKICLEFQYGDDLIYDENTCEYHYTEVDEAKRVIKYASVRDNVSGVDILVSADDNGTPKALSDDVLTVFKKYLNARKPAGVLADIHSYEPDYLRLSLKVQYDPMILNANGSLISNPEVYPVEQAVKAYVSGILYGGVFNKTKLVDAVQNATGVVDVILQNVATKPVTRIEYMDVTGNNAKSVAGSFSIQSLKDSISYVSEL
jgi:hypothetical protein